MSFPTISGAVSSNSTSARISSLAVTLPSSIVAGNLLFIFFACSTTAGTSTMTVPAGWTALYNQAGGGNLRVCAGIYKVASGSEGSSVTVTWSRAVTIAAVAFQVTGYTGTPVDGTLATGSSTAPNPPSLTSGFGAVDTLWLGTCHVSGGSVPSAVPANYSSVGTSTGNGPNPRSFLGVASRNLNASSEDPGAFTITSGQWGANTIAIQGIAVQTYDQDVSISASGSVSVTKSIGKAVSSLGTGTVSLLKRPGKSVSASGNASFTLVRSTAKTVAPSGTGSLSTRKAVSKTLPGISATGSLSIAAGLAFTVLLSVAASGAVSLRRAIGKLIGISGTGTVSQGPRGIGKTVSPSATGALSVRKAISVTRSMAASGTVSVRRSVGKIVSRATTGIVSVSYQLGRVVVIAVTALGTVSVLKQVRKIIMISGTGITSIIKSIGRAISIVATGAVSFVFEFFRFITTPNQIGKLITSALRRTTSITGSGPYGPAEITTEKTIGDDITTNRPSSRTITE